MKPPTTPRPVAKPSSPFAVPVPKGGTGTGRYTTGPISGSGSSARGGGGGGTASSGKGSHVAGPSLAPTGGSGNKIARGGAGGTGGYGNPGPGNPKGRPGIDAVREPDFGPYMRELQRRIKMNWDPPKGNESKRVVLQFKSPKTVGYCLVAYSNLPDFRELIKLQLVQYRQPLLSDRYRLNLKDKV